MRKLSGWIVCFVAVVREVFRSLRACADKTIAEMREIEALAMGKTPPPVPESWPTESTPNALLDAVVGPQGARPVPIIVGEFSELKVWMRGYEAALAAGSAHPEMRADEYVHEFGQRFGRFLTADQVGSPS